MHRPSNRTIWTLVLAVVIYVGVITAIWSYSFLRWRKVSNDYATTTLQSVALNVENMLYVMNQYAGTFLSAFGAVDMDEQGFSCLILDEEQLAHLVRENNEQLLPDFVRSNQLILGAFFCYEPGVFGSDAYQPYYHRGDSVVRQVDDMFAFTESNLFASVKEHHHNWWHASNKKTVFDEAVLGCCTPIYLNDTAHFVGVFVMDYSLDSMNSYLRMVRPYPSAELYIVNSLDYIICETGKQHYGKTIREVPDWNNNSIYGNKEVAFPYLPWKLIMVTPRSEIFAYARTYLLWIVLITMVGLLLLGGCVYLVIRSVRHSAHEQEIMASEIHMAAMVQRSFLPMSLPQLPDVEVDALLQPAKEVAGDIYEVRKEQDYLYFMVGDVSGKGLQSSLMMAMISGMFRMRVRELLSPGQIMQLMNLAISERNPEMQFCTILIGRLHVGSGELLLCNAGHNLPVLNDHFVDLKPGLPIGVELDVNYQELSLQLQAMDRLYLYTDGVTEAENKHHQFFGNERLLKLCQEGVGLKDILHAVDAFADGQPQFDDITMLSIVYRRLVLHSIEDIACLHDYLSPIACSPSPDMTELAIEEALVNPLMHGKATYVSLLKNQQSAIIQDNGISFDPVAYRLSPTASRLSPEQGGQGIALIRKIAKEIHYQRIHDTNILTLSF